MHTVDIVLLAILLLYMLNGFRKGLVLSLVYFGRTLVALWIAWLTREAFVGFVKERGFGLEKWHSEIKGFLESTLTLADPSAQWPAFIRELFEKRVLQGGDVADLLADTLINALVYLILFFLVLLAITLLGHLLNAFFKLPLLKEINHVAGAIFGLLRAVVLITVIVALLTIATPIFGWEELMMNVTQSTLGHFFYEYNVILYIVFAYF